MNAAQEPSPAWTSRPGELLLHPVALMALGLLLVNDHVLKAHWPGLLTGKLSDVAGFVILPLFLHSVGIGVARFLGRVPSERTARLVLLVSCLVTVLAFAAIKLSVVGNEVYRTVFGVLQWPLQAAGNALIGNGLPPVRPVVLVMDPSDLLAVLALTVPWLLLPRRGACRGPARVTMIARQLIASTIESGTRKSHHSHD